MPDYNIHFATDCTDAYAKTDVQMAMQEAADSIGATFKTTFLPVGKFNWIELSYAAAHHYAQRHNHRSKLSEPKTKQIIIVNAAPPKSAKGTDAKGNNERHNFVLGTLNDGTIVAGTYNGLALLRWHIKELYDFGASNNGSQFRSRDVLPAIAILYAHGLLGAHTDKDNKAVQDLALRLMSDEKRALITSYGQKELLEEVDRIANTTRLVKPEDIIPRYPEHSFVVQNDEPFLNTKIKLCKDDRVALRDIFHEAELPHEVTVTYSKNSLADDPENPIWDDKNSFSAQVLEKLFDSDGGDVVFTLGSSSSIINDHGNHEMMAQIITLQNRTDSPIKHPKPPIGAAVKLEFH